MMVFYIAELTKLSERMVGIVKGFKNQETLGYFKQNIK